jgi:DNA-directed RNA polymerase subunit RPC12/RpoP
MAKKIIIRCPKCKKKMKITDKPAKYRCPNCGEVYKYTTLKRIMGYPSRIITGIFQTVNDIVSGVKNKYTSAKNTAAYMKQVKKNMKSDPNWSNVEREKNRMKEAEKANKKSFFDKFKKR